MAAFDPRLTPARPDLAAASLRGKIEAARYAEARPYQILRGRAGLRVKPDHNACMDNEMLFGEGFTVYEIANGWAWGQSAQDGYVGYLRDVAVGEGAPQPDHRVSALMTPLLPAPDIRRAYLDMLPMNAKVKVIETKGDFASVAPDSYVFARHLAPLDEHAADWVAVAERFLGVPYVWGGKTAAGLDCSGLVQTALEAGGVRAPRDADLQQKALGRALPLTADYSGLQRGDLVFWADHVGIMIDGANLLHASAFHMQVAVEPLAAVAARNAAAGRPVIGIKRLQ